MRRLHRWGISRRKLRGGFLHTKLGDRILERELWFPSRESLARAWLVGMPVTAIPFLPMQTLIACGIGFTVRANLPVCFILQYLSNPATAIFQLSACYFVGRLLFGDSPSMLVDHVEKVVGGLVNAPTWREAFATLQWRDFVALYLGGIVLGVVLGVLGYLTTHLIWKEKPRRSRPLHLLGIARPHHAPPHADTHAAAPDEAAEASAPSADRDSGKRSPKPAQTDTDDASPNKDEPRTDRGGPGSQA